MTKEEAQAEFNEAMEWILKYGGRSHGYRGYTTMLDYLVMQTGLEAWRKLEEAEAEDA